MKLHRCSSAWVKIDAHPCWRVQKALDAAGVEYTVVAGPVRRSKRAELEALSGQRLYPVIEFEDGSIYREESKRDGGADQTRQSHSGKWRRPAGRASSNSGAEGATAAAGPPLAGVRRRGPRRARSGPGGRTPRALPRRRAAAS